jgi:hypothetical protein
MNLAKIKATDSFIALPVSELVGFSDVLFIVAVVGDELSAAV